MARGQPPEEGHPSDCKRGAEFGLYSTLAAMDDGRGALVDAWPLFGLIVRTERLELRLPREDELVELLGIAHDGHPRPGRDAIWVCVDRSPRPQFERGFLQYHWRTRSTWSADEWVLDFGVWADGQLVGTQGIHAEKFAVFKSVGTGSWLGGEFQGRRIGSRDALGGAVVRVRSPGRGARDERGVHG